MYPGLPRFSPEWSGVEAYRIGPTGLKDLSTARPRKIYSAPVIRVKLIDLDTTFLQACMANKGSSSIIHSSELLKSKGYHGH